MVMTNADMQMFVRSQIDKLTTIINDYEDFLYELGDTGNSSPPVQAEIIEFGKFMYDISTYNLKPDSRSLKNLEGVHDDLVQVVMSTFKNWPYDDIGMVVIDGLRTEEEQRRYVKEGKSQTMNSRHLTGHAVDIVIDKDLTKDGLQPQWAFDAYKRLDSAMQQSALHLDVDLTWGGGWASFKDGVHFELARETYP